MVSRKRTVQATLTCSHLKSFVCPNGIRTERLILDDGKEAACVVRHRQCKSCHQHFWTLEIVEHLHEGQVTSAFLLVHMRRAILNGNNRQPAFWPWRYTLQSLKQRLVPSKDIWLALSRGKSSIIHLKSLWHFGYPLPHEPAFHRAWALGNLALTCP